jgi:hypothetical protein
MPRCLFVIILLLVQLHETVCQYALASESANLGKTCKYGVASADGASDAVADAIFREADAQERLNDANEKQGELAKLYPKIAANNPMSEFTGTVGSTVTGNASGGMADIYRGQTNVVVNAGLVSSPDQVAQEIQDILNRRARNNGGNPFTGTFG